MSNAASRMGRRQAKDKVPYTGPPPEGEPWIAPDGKLRCGARVRDSEFGPRHCMKMAGPKGRCRFHGGKSLDSNPSCLTNGKRSKWAKYLPARLQQSFEEQEKDEQLQSLNASVHILYTLLQDKLAQLGEAPAREQLREIQASWRRVQKALVGYALPQETKVALQQLGSRISEANLEAALELDIRNIIQEATTVSKVELERMKLLGKFMPEAQVNVIIAGMSSAVTGVLGRLGLEDADAWVGLSQRQAEAQLAQLGGKLKEDIQVEFMRLLGMRGPDVSALPERSYPAD